MTGEHHDRDRIRTVLVDDHALLREGLRALLERQDGIAVVGEAGTYEAALAEVAHTRPDVVVVDLKLSVGTDYAGMRLIEELRRSVPTCAVLVLTTFLDDDLVVRAVRAGARGYVVKDVDTTELVRAIRALAAGGSAFDPRSSTIVMKAMAGERTTSDELTDREREIIQLLAHGMSNGQIGARLYIAESTVKFHIRNLIRKLGVTKRTDAVYVATKRGLI
ncbi:putative two-component response regulator [Gordonia hirsuta DSM 44140 = NBRC 16056]|uniref:Putative two-component response regulator n=1 Tax=Gordonia hirsuta DSM 44140 = NBRC 16056 TaxID=1121927 RepID=L7L9V3_9ACTN|nr:response regulator transcription factor [Gordonia hirsuta]GAC56832.1 putative two-component response regulator [Gordonia hirsuta DSM 44140 = NBRC 16056]